MVEGKGRILVLCVDRDDDLGFKANVKTPILGRRASLEAGVKLALVDPEEADANSIFAAVKTADTLRSKGYDVEVAVISGHHTDSFEADRRIRNQVSEIVRSIRPEGVVLVSDGAEDERVIPIVQQLTSILSVERIVIRHSGSIEESYEVLVRYLKAAVYDPRHSKYALGVPGLVLLSLGLLSLFGLQALAWQAIIIILGAAMIYRGFGIDEFLSKARRSTVFHLKLFTLIASSIIVLAGLVYVNGLVATIKPPMIPPNVGYEQYLVGAAVEMVLPYLWLAIELNLGVLATYYAIRRSFKAARYLASLITASLLYYPLLELALFMKDPSRSISIILTAVFVGLAIVTLATYSIYRLVKTSKREKHGGS